MRFAPTCSNIPIEEIASKGPSCDVAVVLEADLDPVGQPGVGDTFRAAACSSLIVTPTTSTSWSAAAWRAIEPQPQPTSSSRGRDAVRSTSRRQTELAADQLVLGGLGLREPGSGVANQAQEYVIAGPSTSR